MEVGCWSGLTELVNAGEQAAEAKSCRGPNLNELQTSKEFLPHFYPFESFQFIVSLVSYFWLIGLGRADHHCEYSAHFHC